MRYAHAVQTLDTSEIPTLAEGDTGSTVDTIDTFTRDLEDNVGCGNTVYGKLRRIHLD
jgi:hypothetical protein